MTTTCETLASLARRAYYDLVNDADPEVIYGALKASFAEHGLDANIAESAVDWVEGGTLVEDLTDALERAGIHVEARVTGPDLEPPTFRVLDLSTAHLPPVYRNNLNDLGPVTAYEMPYGWLLYVPEDIDEIVAQFAGSTDPFDECLDEFLVTIWRYAHRWGCRYVMFDMDADPIGALPTFDD